MVLTGCRWSAVLIEDGSDLHRPGRYQGDIRRDECCFYGLGERNVEKFVTGLMLVTFADLDIHFITHKLLPELFGLAVKGWVIGGRRHGVDVNGNAAGGGYAVFQVQLHGK